MENRVRVLDKFRIDKQVLTIARPDIWMNMSKDLLFEMTRYANDTVAEAASKYPDRFIPVGTLPVPTEEFLPEFDRCMNELGMAGIQVFSNVDGKYLDAPEFRAVFEKANATKTPIWLHPQLREEWSNDFILNKILGWPFDTSMAMCRLVLLRYDWIVAERFSLMTPLEATRRTVGVYCTFYVCLWSVIAACRFIIQNSFDGNHCCVRGMFVSRAGEDKKFVKQTALGIWNPKAVCFCRFDYFTRITTH